MNKFKLKVMVFSLIAISTSMGALLTVVLPAALPFYTPATAALSVGVAISGLCSFYIWKSKGAAQIQEVELEP